MIDGALACDPQHPRLQATRGVVSPLVTPYLQEDHLHDVVDVVHRHVAPYVAADEWGERDITALERALVAALGEPRPQIRHIGRTIVPFREIASKLVHRLQCRRAASQMRDEAEAERVVSRVR